MAGEEMDSERSLDISPDIPAAYLHFLDSRISREPQKVCPLWEQGVFKVGRDPSSNTFVIETDQDSMVSRNHCEVYVVVYEPFVNYVYIRDRKSFNGTFVNNELIGKGPNISTGHLLEDGDVIELRPYWKFLFRQTRSPPSHPLTSLQVEEAKLFEDKYALTPRCLGHGAEAVVYLAIDQTTKKQLVCKLVNLDKIQGKNSRDKLRRMFQEADILRQVQHPNILGYVDAISSPHSLYMFTELASGGDLMSFTYRNSPVTEFDARIIVRQVVRGLRYLHSKGIVHRDLKPENILLAYSPKIAYHRVVLSDFGTCAVPRRSRMMTNVGTAIYQAPEFLSSTQTHTGAVDVWSLGIVTLLLLTCDSGFDLMGDLSRLGQDALANLLKEEIFTIPTKFSSNGRRFIWRCLQISAAKRMTTMEAECHDWLCTPDKHLEFFEHLDRRMIGDWRARDELRPMPWELPDLMAPVSNISSKRDQRLANCDSPKASSPLSERHANRCLRSKHAIVAASSPAGQHEVDLDIHESNPEPQVDGIDEVRNDSVSTMGVTTPIRQMPSVPTSLEYSRAPMKRREFSVLRINDAAFLPLPGLDRHLRPASTENQRQQILEELKRTNSKFLTTPLPRITNPLSQAGSSKH